MARKDRGENRDKESKRKESEGLVSRVVSALTGEDEKGMKATDLLKRDHDKVKKLFAEYEDAEGSTSRKRELVREVTTELDIHAQLEEKTSYQAFRTADDDEPKKIVRESFEEHKIVKTLTAELSRMSPADEQFDAKVTVLKESVEHHVREEEGELFPAAEELFSDDELERLGAEMEDFKEQLQRRGPARRSSPRASASARPRV